MSIKSSYHAFSSPVLVFYDESKSGAAECIRIQACEQEVYTAIVQEEVRGNYNQQAVAFRCQVTHAHMFSCMKIDSD